MPEPTLHHTVVEGPITGLFLRDAQVAAQVLTTDGTQARLIVAFAAGNSGAGVWFEPTPKPVHWRSLAPLRSISRTDDTGRVLHGIEADFEVDCDSLTVQCALLGSVRVLRDHQADGRLPSHGVVPPVLSPEGARWARDRLDGAAGYRMELQPLLGRASPHGDQGVRLQAGIAGRPLQLRVRALTGDTPLVPLHADDLLNADAAAWPAARTSLSFLAFQGKFLAGSWRYHTYFGRDTLMSLRLLLPVLQPAAIEAGLGSVLERLSAQGEVAHEEEVGEYPILTRLHAAAAQGLDPGPRDRLAEAIHDYKMVDDDFMLLPVAMACLLGDAAARTRAAGFLARRAGNGDRYGLRLARNLAWVLAQAQPFAQQPAVHHLIRLRAGQDVGDWRDSHDGLGGGVYSYSVNAVLVPAALDAARVWLDSGLLDSDLGAASLPDRRQLQPTIDQAAAVWRVRAPRFFECHIAAATAQQAVASYAAAQGLPAPHAHDSGPADAATNADTDADADADANANANVDADGICLSAIALADDGSPVPVMHSDFGFALLFTDPPAEVLHRELHLLMQPFPAGLMTDAGLLVANAVHGDAALRDKFAHNRYHGAVVWSWQQAMFAAGLARQLQRRDLADTTRAQLRRAQAQLWPVILAAREGANGELWSWRHDGSRFHVAPYGPISQAADESNAAQLWSTVYLAVKPPLS